MQIKNHIRLIIISLLLFLIANACSMSYSFTGASISPDIKTVSIQYFQNQAPIVMPSLSRDFTEAMKDRFISESNLKVTNDMGDLNFEGEITGYEIRPQAIQSGDIAASNRLTITVRVKFSNTKDPKQDFDTSFSQFAEYPSEKNFESVERELVNEILKKLTEEAFNKAVVNW